MGEQELPELVGPSHLAGKPASDSDDRHIDHADNPPYFE
jgi:hypothetical protein